MPEDSRLGGEYGADVLVPFVGPLAGYANVSVNHISQGTQVLGTLGLLKVGVAGSPDITDRLGWMVLFDQYTDTRIDDLYLSSLRVDVHYAWDCRTTVGATYTEPLEEDEMEFLLFPGTGTISADVSQSRSVRAYLVRQFDAVAVSGWISYRDMADTVGYGGSLWHPLSERINTVVQGTYEDAGLWSGFAGIEIALGRTSRGCGDCRPCCANLRHPATAGDVVRGGAKVRGYYFEGDVLYETTVKEKKLGEKGVYDYSTAQLLLSLGGASDYARGITGEMDGMDSMNMGEMMDGCPPGFIESPPGSGMCFPLPNGE